MRTATTEERKAVETKFRQVSTAFDVLTDEEQRALFDKCRDWMDSNPGKGLPPLSPEEAAQLAAGAAELRKLRRMGPKLGKHANLYKEVEISLAKLNTGCTKPVSVERRRVDYAGKEHCSATTFHLVIRKGSREGDRLVFESEGNETVDTHPGDLIFTLRAKPHPSLRRKGAKDLETFAAAASSCDVVCAAEVELLTGAKRIIVVPSLREALLGSGTGGVWRGELPGQGLFDAQEPWEAPPGNLFIHVRYPSMYLSEKLIISPLCPGPIWLLGSRDASVSAALLGGSLAAAVQHQRESEHMAIDYQRPMRQTNVTCLTITLENGPSVKPSGHPEGEAVRAMCRVLSHGMAGAISLRSDTVVVLSNQGILIDDAAWVALHAADIIILDLDATGEDYGFEAEGAPSGGSREHRLDFIRNQLESAGILHIVWSRHWFGAHVVTTGVACAFLGPGGDLPIVPWNIRPGGGREGWSHVVETVKSAPKGTVTVGIMAGSGGCLDVGKCNDLFLAPSKDVLIATAGWTGSIDELIEADDDYGFPVAFIT